jgi:glycosyltransferase involved in cell wall biosynthesis
MRIAINTRLLLHNQLEGMGWFTYEIAKRLVAQHPEHEFFFLFDRKYDARFIFDQNVKAIIVPPMARHPILFYLWFEWSLPFVLAKHKVDVFLSPDNFCSLRTKVPTVLVVHDLAFQHFPTQIRKRELRYYLKFMPQYLRRADRIVTVSQFTKQDIIHTYGIANEKIAIACNGVRPHFRPLGEEEKLATQLQYAAGNPYFFYVGSVHPRKNVARLIAAFEQFKQTVPNEMKLLIAGRMAWKTSAVKAALDKAIHKKDIIFLGYVTDEKLPLLLGTAKALIYVSLFEGFGVPILEAMHAEVPVIASVTSSMPEVAGNAAILVDPNSTVAIAEALHKVYNDEALCKALVEKGKVQRTQYSWEKATDIVYENLLLASARKRRT